MATGSNKRERHRLTLEVTFSSENEKGAFQEKLDAVKKLLLPQAPHHRETFSFLNAMLDRVLLSATEAPTTTSVAVTPPARSFLDSSGKYMYILHVCDTFDVAL